MAAEEAEAVVLQPRWCQKAKQDSPQQSLPGSRLARGAGSRCTTDPQLLPHRGGSAIGGSSSSSNSHAAFGGGRSDLWGGAGRQLTALGSSSSISSSSSNGSSNGNGSRSFQGRVLGSASSGRMSLEERFLTLSSPFGSSALGSSSSSSHSHSSGTAAAATTHRHGWDAPAGAAAHPAQRGLQQAMGDEQSANGGSGVVHGREQRTSASSAAAAWKDGHRELTARPMLSPNDFPSLGAASNGNGGISSPLGSAASSDGYTPSIAPYKQGFLAARASAGWTSKLADVPAAAAAAAPPPEAIAGTASSGTAAAGKGAAPAAAGPAADAAGHTAVSLADTLKQSVAAAAAAAGGAGQPSRLELLHRRQSKALVPLVPGSKAKAGSSSSSTPAAAGAAALHGKAGEPGRTGLGWRAPPPVAVAAVDQHPSPSGPQLLTLGSTHDRSAGPGAAAAGGAAGVGAMLLQRGAGGGGATAASITSHPVLLSPTTSSDGGSSQAAAAGSSGGGGGGSNGGGSRAGAVGSAATAAAGQRPLNDRSRFFAVLRRKSNNNSSSSSSSQSSNGQAAGAKGDSAGGCTGGSGTAAGGPACATATAASPAADSDVLPHADGNAGDQGTAAASRGQPSHGPPHSDAPAAPQEQQQQRQQQQAQAADGASGPATAHTAAPAAAADAADAVGAEQAAADRPGLSELLGVTTAEEEAFLRSLGWTDDDEEDEAAWGLTEEEIAAFQAAAAARAAQQQQSPKDAVAARGGGWANGFATRAWPLKAVGGGDGGLCGFAAADPCSVVLGLGLCLPSAGGSLGFGGSDSSSSSSSDDGDSSDSNGGD